MLTICCVMSDSLIFSLSQRLITITGENTELKTLNNRLQHKVKDMNSEYKLRLTKYVEDVAVSSCSSRFFD